MMEHLSEPWGIKDQLSRHLYMNRAAYLYTNTPLNFDVAGKYDHEFPRRLGRLRRRLYRT